MKVSPHRGSVSSGAPVPSIAGRLRSETQTSSGTHISHQIHQSHASLVGTMEAATSIPPNRNDPVIHPVDPRARTAVLPPIMVSQSSVLCASVIFFSQFYALFYIRLRFSPITQSSLPTLYQFLSLSLFSFLFSLISSFPPSPPPQDQPSRRHPCAHAASSSYRTRFFRFSLCSLFTSPVGF